MKYEIKEINDFLNEIDLREKKEITCDEGGKLIPVICTKKEVSEMLKANTRYLNTND